MREFVVPVVTEVPPRSPDPEPEPFRAPLSKCCDECGLYGYCETHDQGG